MVDYLVDNRFKPYSMGLRKLLLTFFSLFYATTGGRLYLTKDARMSDEETRTLVRWARLALTFKGAPQPLAYTLDQALTARAEPEQREAIHRIAADVFGSLWTGTTR